MNKFSKIEKNPIVQEDPKIWKGKYLSINKYKDQEFSLTDCTSFVLMKRLKLTTCFTYDSHFSHMGFRIL